MSALFVTATGTEIGKTYVTVELIRALASRGRCVRALKPIASGFDSAHPEHGDTAELLRAMGLPCDAERLDRVTPWRFSAALSPDMAAAREGRRIDWESLLDFCRSAIETHTREDDGALTLIEGIGGVMVPIDERHTVLDWIAELGIPSLLVAGSYLGTLSHALTAAGMLASRRCRIAAIVVDESPEQPVDVEETAATLARFVAPVPVVVVPRARFDGSAEPGRAAGERESARVRRACERLADLLCDGLAAPMDHDVRAP